MAVADVITILMEYYEDGEELFADAHGPEAVIPVRDGIDLLRGELGGQLEYDTLWAEFEGAPRETAPDLTGALEAMVEADPGLADKLQVLLEEYYATSEPVGAAEAGMPESQDSEFVPRGETRIERHEVEPRSHTDVAGEGTYLYGNVRGGDAEVEGTMELGPDVLSVHREEEVLSYDVRELFDQLRATVDREDEFTGSVRTALREELDGLEAELALGDEADEEEVVVRLRRIGEIDPEFLGLLLRGLRQTRTEARGVVQNALRAMEE